ncbi:transposase [Serinicoccus marinus]|uniref:transposase n=1 Tax=Serinicoccus marinus TaxID=247333 RepID=UPI000A0795AB|nr:transposase [Serinicoccus marinus]
MGHLWDSLSTAYDALGFDAAVEDEVFRQLVLARIIEPTSKADAPRVIAQAGLPPASHRTITRRLRLYSAIGFREQLAAACAAQVNLGPATLVLCESPRVWWRLSFLGRMMNTMAAPRKYSVELQQRATRMAIEARKDPESARGAIKRIADQLGVHPEALRNWVRQAEIDGGVRAGTTTDDAQRLVELEREVRELRRANEILKTSAAFSRLRSSTARSGRGAHRGAGRLHRPAPRRVRGRADLHRAEGRRHDNDKSIWPHCAVPHPRGCGGRGDCCTDR